MLATKPPTILVADDDPRFVKILKFHLQNWGCRCIIAADKSELQQAIDQEIPAVLLLDVCFGEHDGVEILGGLLQNEPGLVVIMISAFGSIDSAVAAMKYGAYDYLTKPPDLNRLRVLIGDGIAKSALSLNSSLNLNLRVIDRIEKQAIEQALTVAQKNVREAAKVLGLGQATVYRKIKRYGIKLS